jgi:hypothetical protein
MKLEKVFVVSHHSPDGVAVSLFKKNKSAVAYLKELAEAVDFELDDDNNPNEAYSDEGDFVQITECVIED